MDTRIVYWASVITVLGWEYAALASAWPLLFHREAVRHAKREETGDRIGWLIHWRLPARAAALVLLLSMIPILAALFLRGWLVIVALAITTGVTLCLWLIGPPGTRLTIMERRPPGGASAFGIRRHQNVLRAVAVFVAFGLLPALALGAVLTWVVARLTT
jgi:hypothetical protein